MFQKEKDVYKGGYHAGGKGKGKGSSGPSSEGCPPGLLNRRSDWITSALKQLHKALPEASSLLVPSGPTDPNLAALSPNPNYAMKPRISAYDMGIQVDFDPAHPTVQRLPEGRLLMRSHAAAKWFLALAAPWRNGPDGKPLSMAKISKNFNDSGVFHYRAQKSPGSSNMVQWLAVPSISKG